MSPVDVEDVESVGLFVYSRSFVDVYTALGGGGLRAKRGCGMLKSGKSGGLKLGRWGRRAFGLEPESLLVLAPKNLRASSLHA